MLILYNNIIYIYIIFAYALCYLPLLLGEYLSPLVEFGLFLGSLISLLVHSIPVALGLGLSLSPLPSLGSTIG